MTQPQGGFDLGTARGRIIIDASGVNAGIAGAERQFNNSITRMGQGMQRFGGVISGIGSNLTLLTAPLIGFGIAGIRAAGNFEDAMVAIEARTGATAEVMESVRQKALQLGADTKFSSQQAADAFLQLLTAGLSVNEAMATLPNVLDAAAAGNLDLGASADIVTNVMSSFGLVAEDTTRIVETMSRAAASSPADMLQIGTALQAVGGIAKTFGLEMEDTAAILAIFAQSGIRGTQASTQLRSVLRNMTADTEPTTQAWEDLGVELFDVEGNMRDLDVVLQEMNASLATKTQQEQIAILGQLGGAYGQIGLSALLGSDGIDAMRETMAGQASVSAVAEARMNTFTGALTSLKGSIETLMITAFTPFIEMLTPLVQRVIEIVNSITAWAGANEDIVQPLIRILSVVALLGPVLIIAGAAFSAIGGLIAGVGALIGFLLSPIGLVIAAVVALGIAYHTNFLGIRDMIDSVIPVFSDFIDKHLEVIVAFTALIPVVIGLTIALGILQGAASLLGITIGLIISPALLLVAAIAAILFVMNSVYPGGLVALFSDASDSAKMLAEIGFTAIARAATQAHAILLQLVEILDILLDKQDDFGVFEGANILSIGELSPGQQAAVQAGTLGAPLAPVRFLSGSRARGGSVTAEGSFLVGEDGPEIFSPKEDGMVIPNGGGGVTIENMIIQANSEAEGAAAARGFASELERVLMERNLA